MENQAVRKLARAVALATLLVPLASIASEAASITCSFGSGPACVGTGSAFGSSAIYAFGGGASSPGGYQVDLFFDQINGNFNVTIEDQLFAQNSPAIAAMLANFPGHICIPIVDGTGTCVVFAVTAPGPGTSTWSGNYDLFASWFANTDGVYGDSPPGSVHLLHALGNADNVFDSDITIPGSYTSGGYDFCHGFCEDFVGDSALDPGVGGTDNSFSGFLATHTSTVPEPGTMLLLASGLGATALRRRKRRNQPS